jgi:dolichol-phosphate mannosyltransferase
MNSASSNAGAVPPTVSVVMPVRNEEGNVALVVEEIVAALNGRWSFEIVCVDDGSVDGTDAKLRELMLRYPNLREVRQQPSGGKAAALRAGVRAARASTIAILDGDGQNNPAYLVPMISALLDGRERVGLVAAQRLRRRDTFSKKLQSRIGNHVRRAILRDDTLDVNCGLKAFPRELFLALPFFDGLHRFLPALVRREGYDIAYVDVVDRPRHSGTSNYGLFDRLWVGIADLLGVFWLIRRKQNIPEVTEVTADER